MPALQDHCGFRREVDRHPRGIAPASAVSVVTNAGVGCPARSAMPDTGSRSHGCETCPPGPLGTRTRRGPCRQHCAGVSEDAARWRFAGGIDTAPLAVFMLQVRRQEQSPGFPPQSLHRRHTRTHLLSRRAIKGNGDLRDQRPLSGASLPDIIFRDLPLFIAIQHVHRADLLQRHRRQLANRNVDDRPAKPPRK
jgi:hypothetical protein